MKKLYKSIFWEWMLAKRYLKSKKKDSFVSIVSKFSFVGIAIGVATLIVVMSVMEGFHNELLKKMVGMKGDGIIFNGSESNNNLNNYEKVLKKFKKEIKMADFIPVIEKQIIFITQNNSFGVISIGMSLEDIKSRKIIFENLYAPKIGVKNLKNKNNEFEFSEETVLNNNINQSLNSEEEDFLKEKKENSINEKNNKGKNGNVFSLNKILIGKRMAEFNGLIIGSKIKLMNPIGEITPFGKLPKEEVFEIIGIFEVGMTDYDKNIVIIPIETADSFFEMNGSISNIQLFFKDLKITKKTIKKIHELSREFNLQFADWKMTDSSFFEALEIEKNVMFIILLMIIITASFNIVSSLVMLVNDKKGDISILRTVGATKNSIMRIFLILGSRIGVNGTVLGTILGIIFTVNVNHVRNFIQRLTGVTLFDPNVYFMTKLPYELNLKDIVMICSFAIFISILSGLYPAIRASRMLPIENIKER